MNLMIADYFQQEVHGDMMRYLYGPLADYSANGGKRHRPLICELACLAVGGDPQRSVSAASAIEHFHTAALIHDDIADESLLRRGQPCMHLRVGTGLAINAGDLALAQVTGLVLADKVLDDATKLRVLDELVQMTVRTIEGQALDLGWARDKRFDISSADYLSMATLKTAHYSGGTPLATGAIVGGANDQTIEGLRSFGLSTGLAFQIQDDLLNLVGKKERTQKDFRSDITEGKRTMLVVHTLEHSSSAEELIKILSEHSHDPNRLDRAVQIMEAAGAFDYARTYATDLVCDAKKRLGQVLPSNKQVDLLLSMADFFI
ncbi:MAG: polyprenyl synthetase family protein, partial [Coriobacteriia bacterium]|nr:polyprenyl synthetase family protein [Coriobacteriia bacterium]